MSRNKNNFDLKLNNFIKENSFLNNNNNKEKNSLKKINILNINENKKNEIFNLKNLSSQKYNKNLKIIHLKNKIKLNNSNNSNLLNLSNYSHDLNIKRNEGELLLTSLNLNNYKNYNEINYDNYLNYNFYTIDNDNRENNDLNIKENKKIFHSKNKNNKLPNIFSDIKINLKEFNKKKYLLKNLINLDDKNENNNNNNENYKLKIEFSPIKIKSRFKFDKKLKLKPLNNNNLNNKKLLNILELQKKKNYVLDYLNEQNIKKIKTERKRLNKIKKNYDKMFNHMKNVTINQLYNYMYSDDVLL